MQPNELRIGNLVKLTYEEYHDLEEDGILNDNNNVFVIRKIDDDGDINIYNEIEGLYEFQHNENLEPIPLTEEWLINFGYCKVPNNQINYFIKGHLIWLPNDLFICDKNGIVLKYVHQLQNLYFALTGKELTHQKIN